MVYVHTRVVLVLYSCQGKPFGKRVPPWKEENKKRERKKKHSLWNTIAWSFLNFILKHTRCVEKVRGTIKFARNISSSNISPTGAIIFSIFSLLYWQTCLRAGYTLIAKYAKTIAKCENRKAYSKGILHHFFHISHPFFYFSHFAAFCTRVGIHKKSQSILWFIFLRH